jgi:hypothetical protein
VGSHEVVIGEVQRGRVRVVLDPLGEPVCEAGEPPDVHAHREVLTLDVRRADLGLLGLPADDVFLLREASRGAVTTFLTRGGAILFDDDAVIDPVALQSVHDWRVTGEAVGGQLDAVPHADARTEVPPVPVSKLNSAYRRHVSVVSTTVWPFLGVQRLRHFIRSRLGMRGQRPTATRL